MPSYSSLNSHLILINLTVAAYTQTLHKYSFSNQRLMNETQFSVNHLVTELNFRTEIAVQLIDLIGGFGAFLQPELFQ